MTGADRSLRDPVNKTDGRFSAAEQRRYLCESDLKLPFTRGTLPEEGTGEGAEELSQQSGRSDAQLAKHRRTQRMLPLLVCIALFSSLLFIVRAAALAYKHSPSRSGEERTSAF